MNFLLLFTLLTLVVSTTVEGNDRNSNGSSNMQEWKIDLTKIIQQLAKLAEAYLNEEELKEFGKQLPQHLNDEITYSVIGLINSGKTTLFTYLLGEELLPPSAHENTCSIARVQKNSTISQPTLISPTGDRITDKGRIRTAIIAANDQCKSHPGKTNVSTFTLQAPRLPGLELSLSDNVIFVDYGGMNSANPAQNKELQREFFQNTNAIILIVKEDDIRGGQVSNILNGLQFLQNRPDISKENVFVVINYLERCLNGYNEYQKVLKEGKIESFSKSNCITYLKRYFMTQLEAYMKIHKNYEGKLFTEDRIIPVGLYDATESLDTLKSLEERKALVTRSNMPELASTLGVHLAEHIKHKALGTLSYVLSVASKIQHRIEKKQLEARNSSDDYKNRLKNQQKIVEDCNSYVHQLQSLSGSFNNTPCDCQLGNIWPVIDSSGSVQRRADSQLANCVAKIQQTISSLRQQWVQLQLSLNQMNIPSSAMPDFLDASIPFPKSANVNGEWRNIRSEEYCGDHWHGGAKRCDVHYSEYSRASADQDHVCNVLRNVIDLNLFRLNSPISALLVMQQQLSQEVESLNHLLAELSRETKMRDAQLGETKAVNSTALSLLEHFTKNTSGMQKTPDLI